MSKFRIYLAKISTYFIRFLKKYWFYLILSIIVILFFINNIAAIISTVIFSILLIIYYIFSSNFKIKLMKFMENYQMIEDNKIAEMLMLPLKDIKECMNRIAKKQKRKQWLIVSSNNRFIFYNQTIIEQFKELFYKGLTEKEIFNKLSEKIAIKSRAQIKAIENVLIEHNRIQKRDLDRRSLFPFDSEFH